MSNNQPALCIRPIAPWQGPAAVLQSSQQRNRLHLAVSPGATGTPLQYAAQYAHHCGLERKVLADGSLLILDIHWELALQLAQRFPTLLVRFEPARHY